MAVLEANYLVTSRPESIFWSRIGADSEAADGTDSDGAAGDIGSTAYRRSSGSAVRTEVLSKRRTLH